MVQSVGRLVVPLKTQVQSDGTCPLDPSLQRFPFIIYVNSHAMYSGGVAMHLKRHKVEALANFCKCWHLAAVRRLWKLSKNF